MEHLFVTATALGDSALELLGEEPLPAQMPHGYDVWRDACEKGTGGVFTLTVDKVLDDLEEILRDYELPY